MTEHLIEAIDDLRRGLRLRFTRLADRLGHTICWVDGGDVVPLLRSREGTDQQSFPPSPPMQQIAIQQVDQRRVAFLVGMAGRSHWSVSVEADGAARQLRFDVACRLPAGQRGLLSSSYDVIEPRLSEWHSGEVHFRRDEGLCVLRSIPIGSRAAPPIDLRQHQIEIRPGDQPQAPTIRWAYELIVD